LQYHLHGVKFKDMVNIDRVHMPAFLSPTIHRHHTPHPVGRKGKRQTAGNRPGHKHPFPVLLHENDAVNDLTSIRITLDIQGFQDFGPAYLVRHGGCFAGKVELGLS